VNEDDVARLIEARGDGPYDIADDLELRAAVGVGALVIADVIGVAVGGVGGREVHEPDPGDDGEQSGEEESLQNDSFLCEQAAVAVR
jgi:hypothetical protein